MKNIYLIIFLFLGYVCYSQETEKHESTEQSESHESHESHSLHHLNHVALFAGTSIIMNGSSGEFALGFDYERRLNFWSEAIGAGFMVETVFAEEQEWLTGISLFLHPSSSIGLKLNITPAIAFEKIKEEPDVIKSETSFFLRLGLAYDFHIKNISITPTLNFDLMKEHTVAVAGMSFGIGF